MADSKGDEHMNTRADEAAALEWVARNFGLEGRLERLAGENLNYLLTAPGGEKYVFKAVDKQSSGESATLEHALLKYVRNAGLPLAFPFIIKNYDERIETGIEIPSIGPCSARLISFVDGEVLEKYRDISHELLFDVGKSLALFDRAIEDFDHPAAHQGHAWELARAGQHRDKLQYIEDPDQKALVAWAFDLWEAVQGALADLPHQVIHGDANKENILVRGDRVAGLVDFGDCCYNPRICELAVCLSYLMTGREDPMEAAATVIAGYASEVELYEEELAVLFPLVCGRLAVTVCMASSRKSLAADNPNWFVSLAPALDLLARLWAIGLDRIDSDA
jgi:Ser/Thr protein kinase RdoA (MazF antagonist)